MHKLKKLVLVVIVCFLPVYLMLFAGIFAHMEQPVFPIFKEGLSADMEAPTAPTNLICTSKTDTSVSVQWDAYANDRDIVEYDVYANKSVVDSVYGTSYTFTGLSPNTAYTFFVTARDVAGNMSEPSNELIVTTDAALSKPANVTAVSTASSVTLTWNPVEGAESYDIDRDEEFINTAELTFTYSELVPNTAYSFRVRARKGDTAGEWSEVLTKYTLLETPTNLNASLTSDTVVLTWDGVSGAAGYKVYRNGSEAGDVTDTTFTDAGLASGTDYTYAIKAYSADNESAMSQPVAVKGMGETTYIRSGIILSS